MVYRNNTYNPMNMENELPVSQNNTNKQYNNKAQPLMPQATAPAISPSTAPGKTPVISPSMESSKPTNMPTSTMPAMTSGKNSAMTPSMGQSMGSSMGSLMGSPMGSPMGSSMGPSMLPSMAQMMPLPTGVPSGPPYGGSTVAASAGVPMSSAIPQTVQNPFYTAGFLKRFIGKDVRIEFLMGTTGPLIDRIGTLLDVGASYVVIRPIRSNDQLMCDLYSIKFVTIYGGSNSSY